ncbi:MAG: hypothetical protein FWE64_02995 [Alphaproteobacteria bacterium]|nr:hypothetical protein [Alphaproteobacteria bacterium]
MKKLLLVCFGLIATPVVAEMVPAWYVEQLIAEELAAREAELQQQAAQTHAAPVIQPMPPAHIVNPRAAATRTPPTRAGAAMGTDGGRNLAPSRAVPARTAVVPVGGQPNVGQPGVSRARVATAPTATAVATRSAVAPTVASPGVAAVPVTASAPLGAVAAAATPARAAVGTSNPLFISSDVATRAALPPISRTAVARSSTPFDAATPAAQPSSVTMEEIAHLTEFCKARYAACMDGFCAVVDDNQGRCACSAGVQRYQQTEEALRQVTDELQNIAISIQYLGLTRDEVVALFTATEAEQAMQQTTDTTQLRADLDRIQRMVLDVRVDGGVTGGDGGMLFDFNSLAFDFSGGFNFDTLFTGGNQSMVRQRGEDLFRSAGTRCRAVLDECRAQGVDIRLITGHYDMEIDRDCVQYERALVDANTNMRRTVLNAQNVLRNARLQVNRNHNQFDTRGCINALDACMQNEFVCGQDYRNCLDPTGRFIVNGELVLGSRPGSPQAALTTLTDLSTAGVYRSWWFGTTGGTRTLNPWSSTGTSASTLNALIGTVPGSIPSNNVFAATTTSSEMLIFLLNRIGVVDQHGRAHGMCASVFNRCQNVTRTDRGIYNTRNLVVMEYLSRTFMNIKAQQDLVLSSFAETCSQDVRMCLSRNNVTGFGDTTNTLRMTTRDACRSLATTCHSVVANLTNQTTQSDNEFMNRLWCQIHPDSSVALDNNATQSCTGTDSILGNQHNHHTPGS